MPSTPAPVSMLGKLFSIGSGAPGDDQDPHSAHPSKPVAFLDSVQEDIHTRSLLFPDTHSLYVHRNDQVFPLSTTPSLSVASMTNAFDYNGELDLEARDVRVLIMQDALLSSNASLLFDSHPCPVPPSPPPAAVQDPRRAPTSPRKSSVGQSSRPLVIQQDNPHLRQGAFDRRGDLQGRIYSFAETDTQRVAREYREELATFTSCIFGSSELMAYKGTSTKVHVVPTESRFADYSTSSVTDGRGSVGRASMRSSRLAQSYSSEIMSPTHVPPSFATSQLAFRPPDRRKILITRLFPVVLPSDDNEASTSQGPALNEARVAEDAVPQKRKPAQPRQKRTPMYAVVLVIQLPASSTSVPKSMFRGSSSLTDQESFPSSFNSTRRSGWTMVGSGNDSLDSSPFEGEDQMDYITQHWDIIMRTLTHLQSVVATTLGRLLKQVDRASPGPYPGASQHVSRPSSPSSRRPDDQQYSKPPKTNSKIITLPPNALSQDQIIHQHTQVARIRIVTGLKAARVVTGQGRWGIWRDEARLASRSFGTQDQRFLLTSLTGFLATHTDWLQALSPAWCRKRFLQQQQKSGGEEDMSVSARTIIVSEDKMLARRFIFLLSAFLPAHQSVPAIHPHRPSTSTSFGPLSQSPPSVIVPIVREESLRRKMTRRSGPRRASHSRTVSQSTRASIPTQLAHLSMEGHHERRSSDAASIRTTNISMPYGDFASQKSVAATTTTISSESTVPHFSTVHRADSRRSVRPGSSNSFAADDLRRSLQRGDSVGQASTTGNESRNQGLKWGSVISGLWSGTRRRDSTNALGEGFRPPASPGFDMPSPSKPSQSSIDRSSRSRTVAEMAQELSLPDPSVQDRQRPRGDEPETPRGTQHDRSTDSGEATVQPRRWPEPGASFESTVKTTVNHEDGVVDVDVPFPDFLTNPHSFDTAVSSPSSSGYLSTPGLGTVMDTFEQACRLALEGDMPLNSAGWLQAYHPDFALQAIPPNRNLVKDVKASLKAEPSPRVPRTSADDSDNKWVDISSAIIADMTTGKITRIRYRRLIKPKQAVQRSPGSHHGPGSVYSGTPLTPSILPYETTLEEEFIEDEITVIDDNLADAVERVISHVGDASKATSSSSSRSNSKARRPSRSPPSDEAVSDGVPGTPTVSHEVPRNECRTVILSALADIIQDVLERRNEEPKESVIEDESPIRSAVRSWLESLDLGSE